MATNIDELRAKISPAALTQLNAMKLGDFGYDDVQTAARVSFFSRNWDVYAAAVSTWIAEKP